MIDNRCDVQIHQGTRQPTRTDQRRRAARASVVDDLPHRKKQAQCGIEPPCAGTRPGDRRPPIMHQTRLACTNVWGALQCHCPLWAAGCGPSAARPAGCPQTVCRRVKLHRPQSLTTQAIPSVSTMRVIHAAPTRNQHPCTRVLLTFDIGRLRAAVDAETPPLLQDEVETGEQDGRTGAPWRAARGWAAPMHACQNRCSRAWQTCRRRRYESRCSSGEGSGALAAKQRREGTPQA